VLYKILNELNLIMKLRLFLLVTCCLATTFAQDEPEEPPPEPPNPCEGLSGVFVNDPSSCQAYFFCVNGQGIANQCEEGFFFNEAEQLCDFEANVACVDCPPTGVHLIPVPGSCTEYFVSHLVSGHFVLQFLTSLSFSYASMVHPSNKSVPTGCTSTQPRVLVTFVKTLTVPTRCVR
jgi:Chitin binding Peritrophin-A domain